MNIRHCTGLGKICSKSESSDHIGKCLTLVSMCFSPVNPNSIHNFAAKLDSNEAVLDQVTEYIVQYILHLHFPLFLLIMVISQLGPINNSGQYRGGAWRFRGTKGQGQHRWPGCLPIRTNRSFYLWLSLFQRYLRWTHRLRHVSHTHQHLSWFRCPAVHQSHTRTQWHVLRIWLQFKTFELDRPNGPTSGYVEWVVDGSPICPDLETNEAPVSANDSFLLDVRYHSQVISRVSFPGCFDWMSRMIAVRTYEVIFVNILLQLCWCFLRCFVSILLLWSMPIPGRFVDDVRTLLLLLSTPIHYARTLIDQ